MCAERMQRILQAIVLGFILGFWGSGMIQIAFLLVLAMIILLLIGGFTGFCPLLIVLKEILPSCHKNKEEKN